MVATQDGAISLYDLASGNVLETMKTSPAPYNVVAGPNNRWAYSVGGLNYVSVMDTSVSGGQEVTRLRNVQGPSAILSADGKYLLVGDYSHSLEIIDPIHLAIVKIVDLSSVLGTGQLASGAMVSVGNKVYIFPRTTGVYQAAVVDLTTYALSSIQLPAGVITKKAAAATPDGSLVLALSRQADNRTHVLFISTATNTVISDVKQSRNYGSTAFLINPSADPTKAFGFILNAGNVNALDLRPGSATYGQVLGNTNVTFVNLNAYSAALNSDGTRLIVVGNPNGQAPARNVNVLDTYMIVNDHTHAVIATYAARSGIGVYAVCTGFFKTTPLGTAPYVTGTSGDITNDQDRQVTLYGGNFQQGALVRVGEMDQVPATFIDGGTLNFTVAANAPAGKGQNIIVTNPLPNQPLNLQNQSGAYGPSFNILPNPAFAPGTQFATTNYDRSFSVYDLGLKTMQNVQDNGGGNVLYWPAFSVDGKELFASAYNDFWQTPGVTSLNLKGNVLNPFLSFPTGAYNLYQGSLFANRDAVYGTPVVLVPWVDWNYTDIHVSTVDTNPASPTFNTIIRTLDAGINDPNAALWMSAAAITPDGKFGYFNFAGTDQAAIGIMNLTPPGAFTSYPTGALNVDPYENFISVSPDGKSLLLLRTDNGTSRSRIRVFDISTPIRPKVVTEIAPAPIPGYGVPFITYFQVVGSYLYAFDTSGYIVVFNFDRKKGDFRQRGYTHWTSGIDSYAFSTNGAYLYLPNGLYDEVAVLDTTKLISGQNVLITKIRAASGPYGIDVSPVAPPSKVPLRHVGN